MSYNDLRKSRVSRPGTAYHITAVTQNRLPHFASLYNGRKVVQQLMALQDQGMAQTLCYVLMPDHLHWLMVLQNGTLPDVVRLLKGRSARAIGQTIWQANYYDHAVRQEDDLHKMARYIVANPLRAKLVCQIGAYSLWDAVWLDDTLSG